jgi:uncharacterized Zn finger protein
MRSYKVLCPHCGAQANIKKSVQISDQYKEFTCMCTNELCGHVWVACLTPVRTLSPSSIPNTAIHIPLSSHVKRVAVVRLMEEEPTNTP